MDMTQNNQEMTLDRLDRAIKVLDQLLFQFALRSGGGPDCLLIREAEEAIRFLRSLRTLSEKENRQNQQ